MKKDKITAYYSILVGIANILLWIMIIISGEIDNLSKELISFLFHWTSEFLMAGLMLCAGFLILKDLKIKTKIYYLGSGMLSLSVIGLVYFYTVNFDLSFLILGIVIIISSTFLVVRNFKSLSELIYFGLGLLIYAQLNISGISALNNYTTILLLNMVAMIFTLFITLLILLKEIEIH